MIDKDLQTQAESLALVAKSMEQSHPDTLQLWELVVFLWLMADSEFAKNYIVLS